MLDEDAALAAVGSHLDEPAGACLGAPLGALDRASHEPPSRHGDTAADVHDPRSSEGCHHGSVARGMSWESARRVAGESAALLPGRARQRAGMPWPATWPP
jgi:hypothetical protein